MEARPRARGAVRPRGRTPRTRAAVLAAARDELEAAGYAGLTLEKVAEHSGVRLATLYRRWRTVEGLVVDLLGGLGKTERGGLPPGTDGVAITSAVGAPGHSPGPP